MAVLHYDDLQRPPVPAGRRYSEVVATRREELIRGEFNRWNAGTRVVDPQLLHEDVVVHSEMTKTTYRGHDGVRRWMAEIDDQFDGWHSTIDEIREAPGERLLVLGAIHFRGRSSGVESDQPMAWLLTFAGDQVTELRTIHGHARALEAARLGD